MKLSKKDASRIQGNGWWVAPDNEVYSMPQDVGSHRAWLENNWQKVKEFDNTVVEHDPKIWYKAFMSGWIRVRIEFDESDMSKPVTSLSCADIDLLDTVPEEMKDIIAKTDRLEFIDMNTAQTTVYDKDQLLGMLHRQRKASLKLSAREVNKFTKYEFDKIPLEYSKWDALCKRIMAAKRRWDVIEESIKPWDIRAYVNKEMTVPKDLREAIKDLFSFYRTDFGMPGGIIDPMQQLEILKRDRTFEKILDALDRAEAKRNQMLEEEHEQNISEADKRQREDELRK